MHARTSPCSPARLLTWALALAASTVFTFGSVTTAVAGPGLLASATKSGSDGHPYHWAAPC